MKIIIFFLFFLFLFFFWGGGVGSGWGGGGGGRVDVNGDVNFFENSKIKMGGVRSGWGRVGSGVRVDVNGRVLRKLKKNTGVGLGGGSGWM